MPLPIIPTFILQGFVINNLALQKLRKKVHG